MGLFWLTESNLGNYIEGQTLNSPIILQYLASEYAIVSVVAGNLPTDLTWTYDSGYVLISLTVIFGTPSGTYNITYRVTELDGSYLDKEFNVAIASSPVPAWLVPSDLGTFTENTSFNLSPIVLGYGAIAGAKVELLNGALPSGLSWQRTTSNTVKITGESDNITADITAKWTFRITNPNGNITDRTFSMTITALTVRPDWTGQPQNLGFVGSTKTAKFTVSAKTLTKTPPTYSLVGDIPSGMAINLTSGVLTYIAPSVMSDTETEVIIRASTTTAFSDLSCYVTVLTIPHSPAWVTSQSIIRVPQEQYLEFPLVAFDPDPKSAGVVYTVVRKDRDFPFTLDSDGLIYGTAPTVQASQLFRITVGASNVHGVTQQEFLFEITQINTLGVLKWNTPTTEILNIPDGARAVYDVRATSSRTRSVKHGITGGQLPPGLLLDKMQGHILGFVDYHMQPKDYWFDLTATDDVDTLVKTMHFSVVPQFGYQFMDISLPLHGDAHVNWQENNRTIFNDINMIVNVAVESNIVSNPELSVVRGIGCTLTDPKDVIEGVKPYLQRMTLLIGSQTQTSVNSTSDLFCRNVIDPQNGSNFVSVHSGLPAQIQPESIQNLRTAFINRCGFANAGAGTGASAVVFIEPEVGAVSGIYVLSSGNGYFNHPVVTVTGKGSGASAYAMAKIVTMKIIDAGTQWQVGEQIILDIGKYDTPAHLVVTQITSNSGLKEVAFVIVDNREASGSYYQVPAGKIFIRNAAGKLAGVRFELGVSEVKIVSGGTGYGSSTAVNFSGYEQLEEWQSGWSASIPMALVNQSYSDVVLNNSKVNLPNPLDGTVWQVGTLSIGVQGAYWQGTTSFDDLASWDGGTTYFEETLTPIETIFDENSQTFDIMDTTFDIGSPTHRDARDNWGETLIDEGTTAFEFYATIFDAANPPTHSSTLVKRLVHMSLPQVSGNNVVDSTTFIPRPRP